MRLAGRAGKVGVGDSGGRYYRTIIGGRNHPNGRKPRDRSDSRAGMRDSIPRREAEIASGSTILRKPLPESTGQRGNSIVELQSYQRGRDRVGRYTGAFDQEIDGDGIVSDRVEQ
jgi:hypothetical protein